MTFEQIFRGRWVLEHAIRDLANRCAENAQLGLFIPSRYDAEQQAYQILSDKRAELEKEFERKRARRHAALNKRKAPARRRSA